MLNFHMLYYYIVLKLSVNVKPNSGKFCNRIT